MFRMSSGTNTWLNRYESRLSLESCLPGEFLSPEQRSCVPVKSGFYASEIEANLDLPGLVRLVLDMWQEKKQN